MIGVEWGLSGQAALDTIEADFRGLLLAASAHAAIEAASALGAGHVDVRVSRQRTRSAAARDARPLSVVADSVTGIGVRVLVDGVWGFASGDVVTPQAAAEVAALAVAMAFMAVAVWFGSKIYRRGLLQTGRVLSWKDAFRKVA